MKKSLTIFLIITGVFCWIWAAKIEPTLLTVKNIDLVIPNWSKSLDGTKIAIISDMHIGSKGINLKKVEKIVKKTNEQNPDVIFFLGDFDALAIKASGIKQDEIVKNFKQFKAPCGKISILGNHDFKPPFIVENILIKSNIKVLEDQTTTVKIKNKTINIVGLKDLWHYHSSPKKVFRNVNLKTSTIVLTHNPDTFDDIPTGVSLILAGHNHGGEIRIPLFGAPFVPSDFGQRFVKGHIAENNKHMFVSSGIGNCSSLRFGNIPEIVILHLYSENTNRKITKNTKPNKGPGKPFKDFCRKSAKALGMF